MSARISHESLSDRSVPPARTRVGADRIGSRNGSTAEGSGVAGLPSSTLHEETYVELRNATCARCQTLEAELERLRTQARVDIENLQTDGIVLRRQVAKLKGELTQIRNKETPPAEVDALLELWVECYLDARNAKANARKPDIGRGGKRWAIAQRAIKRWGIERCENVIRLGCANPYIHFGERVPNPPEPDAKRWIGVEHLLGDEVRFERCEAVTTRQEEEPEQAKVVPIRPLPKAPALRHEGIDDVLHALTARGCAYRQAGPDRWMAQCCVHEDRTPSLSLTLSSDRKVLAHCHGCQAGAAEVREALDLPWAVFMEADGHA